MQDGSLEAVLHVHCNDLAAIFLRRALEDSAHFCQPLKDEIKRLWPPPSRQQDTPLGGDCMPRRSSMKVIPLISSM